MTQVAALLEERMQARDLIAVSVHKQRAGSFYCGFVEETAEERFRLRYINELGAPGERDAMDAWFETSEIRWIKHGTPYLIGLAQLIEVSNRFANRPSGRWRKSPSGIKELCKRASFEQAVLHIDDGYEKFYLRVRGVDDKFVKGTILEDDGTMRGETLIRITAIDGVRSGPVEESATYLASLSEAPR
jgi:hypothetical protein